MQERLRYNRIKYPVASGFLCKKHLFSLVCLRSQTFAYTAAVPANIAQLLHHSIKKEAPGKNKPRQNLPELMNECCQQFNIPCLLNDINKISFPRKLHCEFECYRRAPAYPGCSLLRRTLIQLPVTLFPSYRCSSHAYSFLQFLSIHQSNSHVCSLSLSLPPSRAFSRSLCHARAQSTLLPNELA